MPLILCFVLKKKKKKEEGEEKRMRRMERKVIFSLLVCNILFVVLRRES